MDPAEPGGLELAPVTQGTCVGNQERSRRSWPLPGTWLPAWPSGLPTGTSQLTCLRQTLCWPRLDPNCPLVLMTVYLRDAGKEADGHTARPALVATGSLFGGTLTQSPAQSAFTVGIYCFSLPARSCHKNRRQGNFIDSDSQSDKVAWTVLP